MTSRGRIPGANQFSVWSTDSNGNYHLRISSGKYQETIPRWKRSRLVFGQDLNGDGTIGIPAAGSFALQYKGFDYVAFYNNAYEEFQLAAEPRADSRQFYRSHAGLRHRRPNVASRGGSELY